MLSVDDYRRGILAGIASLAPLELPLSSAHGCVLATDVVAPWPLPSFDNSAMDGYAVLASDVAGATEQAPATLTVIDDVPAGYRATEAVRPGTAVRIMTGAPLPRGADTVVPAEPPDGGPATVRAQDKIFWLNAENRDAENCTRPNIKLNFAQPNQVPPT